MSVPGRTGPDQAMRHPLAHREGINLVLALLWLSGSTCHTCGYGTRVTSKRWARCKQCGERTPRCSMDEAGEKLKALLGEGP